MLPNNKYEMKIKSKKPSSNLLALRKNSKVTFRSRELIV